MTLTPEQMPHNLKFKNNTKTAKFRVLIYAFRKGDPMPEISGDNGNYTVTIGQQVDQLNIIERSGKNSEVKLKRSN